MEEQKINNEAFGDNFAWGISTAAFQTEGACESDGKGKSIWDEFTARKGKVLNGDNAKIACDFYNNYQRDIDLVKEMNIPNFRFSIAWTRILPEGVGDVNQAGIDHYNKVIDYCLDQGVQPWITIYHWDLPQALENRGGWANREIISWFANYVKVCAVNFGNRVKYWMIMNEPAVFTGAGYFLGLHAPGRTGLKSFLPAVHHVVLSIVAGGRKLRELVPDAVIGSTFSCSAIEPYSDRSYDIAAAKRANALINRLFIEPLMGLGYPDDDVPVLKDIKKYKQAGDEANMIFDFDFIGIQNYTREIVRFSLFTPYINAKLVKAARRTSELTLMGWEIHPPAMRHVLKQFGSYKPELPIYVTENGAAFYDEVIDGRVNDIKRTKYLQDHIAEVLKAKQDGVNVKGYFIWTLTDNFEWAEGYHPRFGLVYVDFNNQERIVKQSGRWYSSFLSGKTEKA